MTPAALPFETPLPKAKFRNIHQPIFGGGLKVVNGVKKTTRAKMDNKKLSHLSCLGMESCEEEDDHQSEKRKHYYSSLNSNDAAASSCKWMGDSHIEVSDEDGDVSISRQGGSKKTCSSGSKGCGVTERESHLTDECIDSILDDSYPFLEGNNRRNYYIIRDGRLAEVFRTDIFDRLRKGIGANDDSDDEDVPGTGLARISDRWRAEWSYGIQIPLRADAVNPSEVRKARVERSPSRLNRAQRKRRELVAEFHANAYKPVATSPLRFYECCPMDERWVQLYNEDLKSPGHALPMEVFLQIMNDFEVECYKNIHLKLLEPLHSPSSRMEDADEEAACDICRAIDSEPDDEMVFCDGCNLCVHMSCYGLQELPPNEWMCMKCRLSFGRNPPCVLCPTIGGALKCTDTKNEWAHVVCALWIPECRFGDFEKREPIIRIHEIHEDRWSAKCSICDTRQGACIKCSVESCNISFHATCALRSGLEMRIEQDQVDDRVHMISLCPKHRSAKPFADNGGGSESNQAASDDETEGQYSLGLLSKLEQTCYSFVDHGSVAARMNLDPVVVADVFAYWVKKRLYLNHGKPLIDNLQDDIKVIEPEPTHLELPSYKGPGSQSTLPTGTVKRKRGRPRKDSLPESSGVSHSSPHSEQDSLPTQQPGIMCAKLENSLSKGRKLLELVTQKCKMRRKLLNAHLGAMLLISEHLSKPVPLSHRMIACLKETIENFCSKEVIEEGERRADEICGLAGVTTPNESSFLKWGHDVPSLESTPASSSSTELPILPGASNCSLTSRAQAGSDRTSALMSAGRRSFVKSQRSKQSLSQRNSSVNELEELKLSRRKSLRSSDSKSAEIIATSEEKAEASDVLTESVVPLGSRRVSLENVRVLKLVRTPVLRHVEKTHHRVLRQGSSPFKQTTSSKGFGRNNRIRRRSDLKKCMDESESPPPKRQKSANEHDTQLRLLKSLNLRNANKDFRHRLRNFTPERESREMLGEHRSLRSAVQCSPVPVIDTANSADKRSAKPLHDGVMSERMSTGTEVRVSGCMIVHAD